MVTIRVTYKKVPVLPPTNVNYCDRLVNKLRPRREFRAISVKQAGDGSAKKDVNAKTLLVSPKTPYFSGFYLQF